MLSPQQRYQAVSGDSSCRLWRKEVDEEEDTLLSLSFLLMAASLALRVSCQSQPGHQVSGSPECMMHSSNLLPGREKTPTEPKATASCN